MRNKGEGGTFGGHLGNLDFMLELLRSQRFSREAKNGSVVERPNAESDDAALTLALQVASKVNRGTLHNISEPQTVICEMRRQPVIAWEAVAQLA